MLMKIAYSARNSDLLGHHYSGRILLDIREIFQPFEPEIYVEARKTFLLYCYTNITHVNRNGYFLLRSHKRGTSNKYS